MRPPRTPTSRCGQRPPCGWRTPPTVMFSPNSWTPPPSRRASSPCPVSPTSNCRTTLRAFVWTLPHAELVVLDWQHPAYRFRPAHQALTWRAEWRVPVYPDGDYYAFLTQDFTEGTFGHPWEKTLCVIGERLGASLGRSLETWLPVKRRDGAPV